MREHDEDEQDPECPIACRQPWSLHASPKHSNLVSKSKILKNKRAS
jgi:hypothetical protein